MMNIDDNVEMIVIHNGQKILRPSDIDLEKLGKTPIIENRNYLNALKRIPDYFNTNDLFTCMMFAFKYGENKGREYERDLIKWNALATFEWMKKYFKDNGYLPETQKDLYNWEKRYLCEKGFE